MDVRPTDEAARAAGFNVALEWYSYSTSGHLRDPALVLEQFESLPAASVSPDDSDRELDVTDPGHREMWGLGDRAHGDIDITAVVREERLIDHPYLLTDVEQLNRLGPTDPLTRFVLEQGGQDESGEVPATGGTDAARFSAVDDDPDDRSASEVMRVITGPARRKAAAQCKKLWADTMKLTPSSLPLPAATAPAAAPGDRPSEMTPEILRVKLRADQA